MNRKIYFLFIFLFISVRGFSQYQDFQTWWAAGVKGELFDKIDFEVAPEIRLFDNSSRVRSIHTDFELSYPVTKFFRFGGKYRLQQKNYTNGLSYINHRYGIYGKLDGKINRLRFDYRAIYQVEYEGINHREKGNLPAIEQRHRIAASYYRKKWDLRPEVSYELFLLTRQHFFSDEVKSRLTAGVSYKVNKDIDISIDYKLQHEYLENNPLTAHILAVKFSYELK